MGYKRLDIKPDKLTVLIRGYGFNGTGLGKVLGVSYYTGTRRINDPSTLTVGELRQLMKKIPKEEVLAAL